MPIKTNQPDDISSANEEVNRERDNAMAEIPTTENMIYPLQNLTKNTFLTAGFKVKDKLLGIEMLVIGFTNTDRIITVEQKLNSIYSVYQKIFCNVLNLSDYELFGGDKDKKIYYHFFLKILHSWKDRNAGDDDFYFVCKYWNIRKNDFSYMARHFFEVEYLI